MIVSVGHDRPFPNNYGVWTDEFEELGLQHTLEARWHRAVSFFGEDQEVKLDRGYGRQVACAASKCATSPALLYISTMHVTLMFGASVIILCANEAMHKYITAVCYRQGMPEEASRSPCQNLRRARGQVPGRGGDRHRRRPGC